jgi:hypothetical protein
MVAGQGLRLNRNRVNEHRRRTVDPSWRILRFDDGLGYLLGGRWKAVQAWLWGGVLPGPSSG